MIQICFCLFAFVLTRNAFMIRLCVWLAGSLSKRCVTICTLHAIIIYPLTSLFNLLDSPPPSRDRSAQLDLIPSIPNGAFTVSPVACVCLSVRSVTFSPCVLLFPWQPNYAAILRHFVLFFWWKILNYDHFSIYKNYI